MSSLGRGALAAERWDPADTYARDTYTLAMAALKGRSMDQEPRLPIAVATLQRELATYKDRLERASAECRALPRRHPTLSPSSEPRGPRTPPDSPFR